MSCDDFAAKIGAYVDAELSPDEMRAAGRHVHECAACAAMALEAVGAKRAVKVAGLEYVPSPDFRRKIQAQVSGNRSRRVKVRLIPLLAVAAGVLIAVSLLMRTSSQVRDERLGEVADLHVSALASANPVDVVSTDRHTVKPWFQGKLPFTFELPDPEASHLALIGGRVVYLGRLPAAQVIYQVRQHRISVFISQQMAGDPLAKRSLESSETSFKMESWAQGGLRYFVVGDAAWEDIHSVAAAMKKAAASA